MRRTWDDESGQATVEYALVLAVLLAVILGVAALWRFAESGGFVEAAAESSSHATSVGGMQDALLY